MFRIKVRKSMWIVRHMFLGHYAYNCDDDSDDEDYAAEAKNEKEDEADDEEDFHDADENKGEDKKR